MLESFYTEDFDNPLNNLSRAQSKKPSKFTAAVKNSESQWSDSSESIERNAETPKIEIEIKIEAEDFRINEIFSGVFGQSF